MTTHFEAGGRSITIDGYIDNTGRPLYHIELRKSRDDFAEIILTASGLALIADALSDDWPVESSATMSCWAFASDIITVRGGVIAIYSTGKEVSIRPGKRSHLLASLIADEVRGLVNPIEAN